MEKFADHGAEQERAQVLAAFREFIDLLEANPELPVPGYTTVFASTLGVGDPAPVYEAAKVLGSKTELQQESGVYTTRKKFGLRLSYSIASPTAPKQRGTVVVPNLLVGGE